LAHRLLPTPEAQISRRTTSDILTDVLARVAVPAPSQSRSATR
jgi:hypothetical protein